MTHAIAPSAIPARAEDALATEMGDGIVLMSMDSGKFVELNDTAREVWNLADGATSVAAMVERLGEIFEVSPEQCRADVTALLATLREQGLIRFDA